MNAFERANLARLAATDPAYKEIQDLLTNDNTAKLREWAEGSARLLVRLLFETHSGNLEKIKQALRDDTELIKGLEIDKIVNDEYKRQGRNIKLRHSGKTQRAFWETMVKLESERSAKLRDRRN